MSAVRVDPTMLAKRFSALAELVPLSPPRTQRQYDRMVDFLNAILDAGGADEKDPLADLAGIVGTLVSEYESRHLPIPEASGISVLRFLMDQHGLRQSDLPEIGSQGVVSEILAGKRELRASHVKLLAKRFSVPGDVFL